MKNLKDIRQTQYVITEATAVEKLHAAAMDATEKAKASPSVTNHRAAADAHEKALDAHEKTINSLIKKGGASDEVKKHEAHIKMHKNEAQKHRFAAHRLGKSQQNEGTVTEAKFKVTFVHRHPEGEKQHDYVVSAPHQNAADKKAITMHRQAHPKGDFHMWDSQEVYEGLEDACWKGYEAIGMKMKNGKEVPNCVPKEDTTTIEKPVAEDSNDKNLRITKHEKMAVEAGKRGDKQAQQYHLEIVKKMQNESVNEAAEKKEVQKHLVTVTVTDPQHQMASKRKEKIMKRVKVSAADPKEAVKKAEAHYKKHGFKVHDSLHHSVVKESLDTDEFIDSYDPEQNEDKNTEEIQMAKAQLREIADMAQDLVDAMEDDDVLEPWMQFKITSANKDLDDVYSTIAYGDEDDSEQDDTDSETDSGDETEK